jgi:hypothetical protein
VEILRQGTDPYNIKTLSLISTQTDALNIKQSSIKTTIIKKKEKKKEPQTLNFLSLQN